MSPDLLKKKKKINKGIILTGTFLEPVLNAARGPSGTSPASDVHVRWLGALRQPSCTLPTLPLVCEHLEGAGSPWTAGCHPDHGEGAGGTSLAGALCRLHLMEDRPWGVSCCQIALHSDLWSQETSNSSTEKKRRSAAPFPADGTKPQSERLFTRGGDRWQKKAG